MELQPKKRNKGENILAHSITESGKNFGSIIRESSLRLRLCESLTHILVERLAFVKSLSH
jgi:hypothetical protein